MSATVSSSARAAPLLYCSHHGCSKVAIKFAWRLLSQPSHVNFSDSGPKRALQCSLMSAVSPSDAKSLTSFEMSFGAKIQWASSLRHDYRECSSPAGVLTRDLSGAIEAMSCV